ncbi:hypothetical protein G9A89_000723 [Geosiphon pyriformis]|nr:hypothetical protein G9A89_000723 [Geosiphon pyriformis]
MLAQKTWLEVATHGWYTYVLTVLTNLELLGVLIECCVGFGQPVIANKCLNLIGKPSNKIPSDYHHHQLLCTPSYSQQLRLNSNHYPAESAFNFYINDKITECLGGTVNIETARENFYTELFQHTNLPRNYSFTPIIREINQIIERYTQQQFLITYTDKGKERLQTPAVTSKEIQLPTWKKQRIEFPPYLSYHYTSGSTINILSTGVFTPNVTSTFGQFPFQKIQSLPPLPDFGISDLWEVTESEKEEEEKTEDQEFTYQNLITENLEFETPNLQNQQNLNSVNSEVETPNIQTLPTQDNRNPNLINQPNLLSLINKPQDFNAFKVEFLRYFSNNNSINYLVNTFTIMKQGETEAVITYLRCFHRNLHQIQAIDANYFTAPQILNQFIRGLHSSILQHVCPLHSGILQDAVTHTRDFESAESEANHAQAINLVINRSSELNSKLKQFSDSINQKLEEYLADNCTIYQPLQ